MTTESHVNGTANGVANGVAHRTLRPGVWAPIPTFFTDDEDLGKLTKRRGSAMSSLQQMSRRSSRMSFGLPRLACSLLSADRWARLST